MIDDVDCVRTGVARGGYVLADAASGEPDVLLIATGSEVSLAIAARKTLAERGLQARVVSMPSQEIFEEQPETYRDEVLPPSVRARLVIEAGSPQGWHKYAGDEGDVAGIDHFGASAPAKVVFEKFGFTPEKIAERAAALIERARSGGA